MVAHRVLWSLG